MDSSCYAAIVLGERGAAAIDARLASFDGLIASNLMEAEVRAVLRREKIPLPAELLESVEWVLPVRALSAELERVFLAGYLRGADAWHLACALFYADGRTSLTFLTLDAPQREVAARLGFAT